ncbi:MAG: hypothetical protein U1F44_04625 [Coriobacteriia bacterium]|nr:hypothetical protein [Coriobacteriia bacterium]
MSDPEEAIAIFREFEKLGVRLVVDDFGTGYLSSPSRSRTVFAHSAWERVSRRQTNSRICVY